MRPRLLIVSGPGAGTDYELKKKLFTIGRDRDSDLRLTNSIGSRKHCIITFDDHVHYIEDLGSLNGTIVEARQIFARHPLTHGDRVAAGDIVFVYLAADDDAIPDARIHLVPDIPIEHPHSVFLDRSALLNTAREAADAVRGKPEDFSKRLLDIIFNTTPADRASILLDHGGTLEVMCWRDRRNLANSVRASTTIVRRVIKDGAAIVSSDLVASGMLTIPSVKAAQVESIICVPLEMFGHRFGAIYGDCFNPEQPFGKSHVDILSIVAMVAAAAFKNASEIDGLRTTKESLEETLGFTGDFIGRSRQILELKERIAIAGPTDSTILIQGDTGTGKELAARLIHRISRRSQQPFVAINCANLSRELLATELFGHERGAFTGAHTRKIGKFEHANGGTILLDEIGDMPFELQAKLLRVLQEKLIDRVGGLQSIPVDVRVIAATNRNLQAAVAKGEFREDLYFRLNVIPIRTPPLRERPEDIPILATHFFEKYRKIHSRRILDISSETMQMLVHYAWPGNARELQNLMERAVVMCRTETIVPQDLAGLEPFGDSSAANAGPKTLLEIERNAYKDALIRRDGDYKLVAADLGVHPGSVHRRVKKLKLEDYLKP